MHIIHYKSNFFFNNFSAKKNDFDPSSSLIYKDVYTHERISIIDSFIILSLFATRWSDILTDEDEREREREKRTILGFESSENFGEGEIGRLVLVYGVAMFD